MIRSATFAVVAFLVYLLGIWSFHKSMDEFIYLKDEPVPVVSITFQGRVIPPDQISPGTFTIKKPWEEVSHWGKNSVLTARRHLQSIQLEAWRPDPNTPGVFEYSSTSLTASEFWSNPLYEIGGLEFVEEKAQITPRQRIKQSLLGKIFWNGLGVFFFGATAYLFWLAIVSR